MLENIIPLNREIDLIENTKNCNGLRYTSAYVRVNGKTKHIGRYITGYGYAFTEKLLYNEYGVAIVYKRNISDKYFIGALYDITTDSFVCDVDEAEKRFNDYFGKNKVYYITQ